MTRRCELTGKLPMAGQLSAATGTPDPATSPASDANPARRQLLPLATNAHFNVMTLPHSPTQTQQQFPASQSYLVLRQLCVSATIALKG